MFKTSLAISAALCGALGLSAFAQDKVYVNRGSYVFEYDADDPKAPRFLKKDAGSPEAMSPTDAYDVVISFKGELWAASPEVLCTGVEGTIGKDVAVSYRNFNYLTFEPWLVQDGKKMKPDGDNGRISLRFDLTLDGEEKTCAELVGTGDLFTVSEAQTLYQALVTLSSLSVAEVTALSEAYFEQKPELGELDTLVNEFLTMVSDYDDAADRIDEIMDILADGVGDDQGVVIDEPQEVPGLVFEKTTIVYPKETKISATVRWEFTPEKQFLQTEVNRMELEVLGKKSVNEYTLLHNFSSWQDMISNVNAIGHGAEYPNTPALNKWSDEPQAQTDPEVLSTRFPLKIGEISDKSHESTMITKTDFSSGTMVTDNYSKCVAIGLDTLEIETVSYPSVRVVCASYFETDSEVFINATSQTTNSQSAMASFSERWISTEYGIDLKVRSQNKLGSQDEVSKAHTDVTKVSLPGQ